ncbi:MAG: hypothetical protein AAFV95_10070 [Bacteroidota bacterium]
MFQISKSVGRNGVNLIKDVRIVQQSLLHLGALPPAVFIEECLHQSVELPVQEIKNRLIAGQTNVQNLLDALADGSEVMQPNQLQATIQSIEKFQREKVGLSNPDGLISPSGKTAKMIKRALKQVGTVKVESHSVSSQSGYDINILRGRIQLSLRLGGPQKIKQYDIAAARRYISTRYNWNGILKLMQQVYAASGDAYLMSTQLSGTNSDDELLIPDQGIAYIIQMQLEHALKGKRTSPPNLDRLLSSVDARPGDNFLQKILRKKDRLTFMDESINKSVIRVEDQQKIQIPSTKDDEATMYEFCRDIVRARNGLWSDLVGVCNLVGFRRLMDPKSETLFNDTIAVCWKEADGKQRVELNIATTEPGNRKLKNQLAPQTLTLLPGYHINRQPAGRTHNGLKRLSNGRLKWSGGDTTMNFHQGKNNFTYTGNEWLTKYGINWELKTGLPKNGMDEKDVLNLNAILSEIYLLLSAYGGEKVRSSYSNLKRMSVAQPIVKESTVDGIMTLSQATSSRPRTKKIDLKKARQWMLDTWYRKREKNRHKILDILLAITDFPEEQITSWKGKSKEFVSDFVTLDHLEKVVETQAMHVADIRDKQLDGLAGEGFVEMLRGVYQPVAEAKADKERVDELLEELESFPLKNVGRLQKDLKNLQIATHRNRKNVYLNTAYDVVDDVPHIEHVTVGRSSEGCQVIYDTEVFYTFWTSLLQRSAKVGQYRWYYTLIETTRFKKSSLV